MTPLMMLALTLPPSLAFVLGRWMAGREAQARKLALLDQASIAKLAETADVHLELIKKSDARAAEHAAELKRLNEQLTILADRR